MRRRLLCVKKIEEPQGPTIAHISNPLRISITKPKEQPQVDLTSVDNLIVIKWPDSLGIEFEYDDSTSILIADKDKTSETDTTIEYIVDTSDINQFFEDYEVPSTSTSLKMLSITNKTNFSGTFELMFKKLAGLSYSLSYISSPSLIGGTVNAILSYVYLEKARSTTLLSNASANLIYYVHSNYKTWTASAKTKDLNKSYISIDTKSGGSELSNQLKKLNVSIDENESTLTRSHTLTISTLKDGSFVTQTSTITQPGRDTGGTGGQLKPDIIYLYCNLSAENQYSPIYTEGEWIYLRTPAVNAGKYIIDQQSFVTKGSFQGNLQSRWKATDQELLNPLNPCFTYNDTYGNQLKLTLHIYQYGTGHSDRVYFDTNIPIDNLNNKDTLIYKWIYDDMTYNLIADLTGNSDPRTSGGLIDTLD